MTNEELVQCIQDGEKGLSGQLWANVEKLVHLLANRLYTAYRERCEARGIDREDIRQEGFLAMMDAVGAYDPSRGFAFVTYLHHPLANRIKALLFKRGYERVKEISYDQPIGDDEGETLWNTIPAPDRPYNEIIEQGWQEALNKAMGRALAYLTPEQRLSTHLRYYEGLSGTQAAQIMGIPANREAHIHRKALLDLSRGRPGLILSPFWQEIRTWRPGLELYRTDGGAVVGNVLLLEQAAGTNGAK
mgnify:CR=1 FL=1